MCVQSGKALAYLLSAKGFARVALGQKTPPETFNRWKRGSSMNKRARAKYVVMPCFLVLLLALRGTTTRYIGPDATGVTCGPDGGCIYSR